MIDDEDIRKLAREITLAMVAMQEKVTALATVINARHPNQQSDLEEALAVEHRANSQVRSGIEQAQVFDSLIGHLQALRNKAPKTGLLAFRLST